MHPKICCVAKGKLLFFLADLFMWHQHPYKLTLSSTVSLTDICYIGRKHFSWNCFPRSSWQIQWIQRLFYFYKVCTSRAETQKCSKTSGDITSEGAQIIVTPIASNPTPEFWLYLCVRAAPGGSSGAAEQGLKCHIYRCLLLALADISQIFHLQERAKRKGKIHISFSERKKGVMRCAFPMYPNYTLKEPLKRHFKKLSKGHWSHETGYFLSK